MSRKVIAADYAAMEVRVFAHFSGDKTLQSVFPKGEDIYSKVAIDVLNRPDLSAHPEDDNFLKAVEPSLRDLSKVFCFTESTLVEVQGRGLISIKDIKVGDLVRTSSGFKPVTKLFKREAKAKRLITNKSMFKVTEDHPFWSKDSKDWVEVKNLNEKEVLEFEQVFIPDNEREIRLPVKSYHSLRDGILPNCRLLTLDIDEEWCWAIGAFLGDGLGSYTNKKWANHRGFKATHISSYVGICGLSEETVVARWDRFINKLGFEPKVKVRKREGEKPLKTSLVHSNELVRVFEDTLNLIIDKKEEVGNLTGRKNLRLPYWIFNAPFKLRLAMLAGLLDTDGYLKSKKGSIISDVQLCSKSFDLISDVSNLLNGMGIANTLQLDWNTTYKKYYYIVRIAQEGIYKLAEMDIQSHLTIDRKIQAFSDRLINKPNKVTSKAPCIVKKVIDLDEEVTVYDITVEGVHEFIANGTRVHNCLSVPYGAGGFQVAAGLDYTLPNGKIDSRRGESLINDYLSTYPNLRKYMVRQDLMFKKYGYVKNLFGRIRRFEKAHAIYKRYGDNILDSRWAKQRGLTEDRKTVKKAMNAAKNFPIQSTAASIVNRAMIELGMWIEESGLDINMLLQVHDEVVIECDEKDVEIASEKLKYYMEHNEYAKLLEVPLISTPIVGNNLAECK